MAVLDSGDEAIVPAPYWVSYPDMVLLADALPVMPFAGPAQGYKITPRQLAAAITPQTRLVLLNSPCNPTGAAYTRAELRAFGEVLLEHPRVIIGTDDMYEKIFWAEEPFCSLLTAVPELYGRTVTINGCSKAYAMTGWRVGYCGGPKEIITAMATIQGQSTPNACSISQKAAAAASQVPAAFTRVRTCQRPWRPWAVETITNLRSCFSIPAASPWFPAPVSARRDTSGFLSPVVCPLWRKRSNA